MENDRKTKKRISGMLLFILLIATSITAITFGMLYVHPNDKYGRLAEDELINVNTSDLWDLPYKILIDGNWSETRDTYGWCDGSGTQNNPYVIENVIINGQDSGITITIRDTNDYFIINNCSLYNASASILLSDYKEKQCTGGESMEIFVGIIIHYLL